MFSAEIQTNPGDTTIFVNDFVISTDLDFVAGHEYEVLVQRPSGIGRRALAKGRFTLGE
jgi:hypothetical protein